MRLKCSVLLSLSALVCGLTAAEQPGVVTENKINVRGQPSLVGEVVTQLQKGDKVTVLDEVNIEKPKPGEPTNWAKIKLPANTPVWVFASMVKDGAVTASRLNLRAGPGENYSVLGRLDKGDTVKPIRTVEQWTEIEAPTNAYAFVDASLIKVEGESAVTAAPAAAAAAPVTAAEKPAPLPAEKPAPVPVAPVQKPASELQAATSPAPVPPPATNNAAAAESPAPVPSVPAAAAAAAPGLPATLPKVAEAPAKTETEETGTRRVVRREGIIRPTKSIQAPTWYELVHPQTKVAIDFLHEEKLGIKLKEYKGQKVVVTGEEAVDPRWPNTPILEIETLDIAP